MPFTKGNSGNPLGKPKGSLNSSTKEFRELLSHSIDSNKIMETLGYNLGDEMIHRDYLMLWSNDERNP